MFILKKHSFIIKGLVVFLAITLISTSVFSQISRSAEIIVNTDQPQYYPGETVYITGRIGENGTGVPSSTFCVTVFDPDGNISSGICGITDSQGNFSYDYTLFGDAKLGTYEVFVE